MLAGLPSLTPAACLRPAEPERLPTGLPQFDRLTGGLPCGAITELSGPACSGRTSLILTTLAAATARRQICALVDATDAFDPSSAAAAGLDPDRLLWVRCGGDPERALKAADRVVNAGGFGLIVVDLADIAPRILRRIPLVCWFRLRRAVEGTPAVLLVVTPQPSTGTCASLLVEMKGGHTHWSGAPNARLLQGGVFELLPRKPIRPETARLQSRAQWMR